MGCIGQISVGLGKLGEVIAGQCRMEKSIAGKGKSTYNSHLELSKYTIFLEYLVISCYKK